MTAAGTVLARPISLRVIPVFVVACFAIASASAQQQIAAEVHEYKATVVAAREGEVAPRLDGLLVKINFTAGQFVKEGDLLFEFDTRDKKITLALAQASLEQAEAQFRLAEVKLTNAQTLQTRNVASKMQLLEAQAERDIAAAKAKEARANMQLAELALMEMKLYAPISGVISRPFIREGAYITKEARDQSRLATVVQLDPIQVVGQVPAAMYFQRGEVLKSIDQIAEQREFNLVLPTGDKYPHKGRPVAGSFEFNAVTQTIEVAVEFPNPNFLLRPGLNVVLLSSIRTN
jgi:membrane fusion protein (multidrug efflux system)